MSTRLQRGLNLVCASVFSMAFVSPAFAAHISLCNSQVESAEYQFQSNLYSETGSRVQLYVSDNPVDDNNCRAIEIAVGDAEVLWAAPLPDAQFSVERPFLNLIGTFTATTTLVSEITGGVNPPRQEPASLLGENLLPRLTELVFGSEARASWGPNDRLSCAAGESVAGIRLSFGANWPERIPLQLQIRGSGQGKFTVAVSDQARIDSESPLAIGEIGSEVGRVEINSAIELPRNSDSWAALTLVCPMGEAQLDLESIAIQPVSAAQTARRAAWVWSPDQWLNNSEALWSLQEQERLDELFLSIPVDRAGNIINQSELETFVTESRSRGIQVWPVIGDPRDVLERNLPALLNRTNAYLDYNRAVEEEARLAGLQLDIEPYLLPGFTLGVDHWRERYLQTITAVHDAINEQMVLDLVIPYWFGIHESWGSRLFDRLTMPNLSLTVMNYRTNDASLREGALPFLQWGLFNGNKVRIALESGSLPDQNQRTYTASPDAGELWQYYVGSTPVLVLFDREFEGSAGRPYTFSSERNLSSNNVTFSGDLSRLNAVLGDLEAEWRAWPSFGGIAIHGLDEIYLSNVEDE
jgi:hypothetical protein